MCIMHIIIIMYVMHIIIIMSCVCHVCWQGVTGVHWQNQIECQMSAGLFDVWVVNV